MPPPLPAYLAQLAGVGQLLGEAKVCDLEVSVVVHEQVLGLEVPVAVLEGVDVLER
jgi:hypothetical protein